MRKSRMPAASIAALLRSRPNGVVGSVRAEGSEIDQERLERVLGQVKSELTRVGNDAIKRVEKLEHQLEALDIRNQDLEQKLAARRGGGGAAQSRGAFAAALDCEGVRNAVKLSEQHGRTRFTVNAAILTGAPNGPVPKRDHRPEIIAPAQRALRVRDLMTVTPTTHGAVEFIRETGFTNNAAPVTEGETKPESTLTFELVTATPKTIAHWTQASKQVLADVSRLQSFLDGRMRYGVQLEEDAQLLLGSGTGQNLSGLVTEATAFGGLLTSTGATQADYIGSAIAQLRTTNHEPDGIVLHPNDWMRILQEKGEDGHYIVPGGPFSTTEPMLFQKPVALTTAMDEDSFLVGQFAIGAEIFEREETTVEISTEDSDNFRKNLVTVRAEERIVLATYRPEAFVTGDFGLIT